jgi:hypothetical protein
MSDAEGASAWMNSLKVKPTALIGFSIAVAYPVLFLVLERFLGPAYTDIGKTADSVLRGIVIPLAICTVVTAGLTTWLGWWRPVMREKPVGVKWMWSIPVVLGLWDSTRRSCIAACQSSRFAGRTRRCTCGS